MREKFFELLDQLQTMRRNALDTKSRQAAMDEEVYEEYFKMFPRRRKRPSFEKLQAIMPEKYNAIFEKHKTLLDEAYAEYKAFEADAKKRLTEMADAVEIAETETPVVYHTTWESTYSTQSSPRFYARNAAEMHQKHCEACGVKSEVVVRIKKNNFHDFDTVAYCAEEDLPLLKYKSGPTLREMVKKCWASGRNPRVHMPFLPHGYEESVGLDFFGNDVAK